MRRNTPIAESAPTARQEQVAEAVRQAKGNYAEAARVLGISRVGVRQTMNVLRTKQRQGLKAIAKDAY